MLLTIFKSFMDSFYTFFLVYCVSKGVKFAEKVATPD